MSRFVLVSFGVLGWAFYELSGGADFEPPERPALPPQQTVAKLPKAAAAPSAQKTSLQVPQEPVLAPRKSSDKKAQDAERERLRTIALQQKEEREKQLLEEAAASRAEVLERGLVGGLGALSGSLDTTTITFSTDQDGGTILVTTEGDATEAEEPETPQEPEPDIREVTGTRVNMRDGPGTIYPVIGRLNIGDQVEVLGDSGGGWLRLRTVENRQIGWISSSLISKKVN